jgi:hypothetical protein
MLPPRLASYAVGNARLFRAPASTARRAKRARRVSPGGMLATLTLLLAPVAIVLLPQATTLVYAAWMFPMAELALMLTGLMFFRYRFREKEENFTELIIQITTAGYEQQRVEEIIAQIRGYRLDMPYWVWVVTEPHDTFAYSADYCISVPKDFQCNARAKARALEYSRRVRQHMKLDRRDVKIIYNDDDVTLTRAYIETGFRADYDLCEGVITPRHHYAVRPFGHFLASHADDIRTHACLVYCSTFQGLFRRPLHVHGEGMVTTGYAESLVTWDYDMTASEDLVFGQQAAKLGLRWGWFHEYAEVTSPWTLSDYLKQRRRWLWGDIHALRRRGVLPLSAAGRVLAKYLAGVLALACSIAGLWLRVTGRIPATAGVLNFGKLALISWVALAFTCGWIGASAGGALKRDDDSRLLAGLLAVIMMPVSVLLTFAAILIPLAQGDPRGFHTIRKTK